MGQLGLQEVVQGTLWGMARTQFDSTNSVKGMMSFWLAAFCSYCAFSVCLSSSYRLSGPAGKRKHCEK